jgi:hypothetical protein
MSHVCMCVCSVNFEYMDSTCTNLLYTVTSSNRHGILVRTACSIARIAQSGNAAVNNLSGPGGQGTGSRATATAVEYVLLVLSYARIPLAPATYSPSFLCGASSCLPILVLAVCVRCQPTATFGQHVLVKPNYFKE